MRESPTSEFKNTSCYLLRGQPIEISPFIVNQINKNYNEIRVKRVLLTDVDICNINFICYYLGVVFPEKLTNQAPCCQGG